MRDQYGTVSFWAVREAGRSGERAGDKPGHARNRDMLRLRRAGWTYEAIGELYGISRERVHQLLGGGVE